MTASNQVHTGRLNNKVMLYLSDGVHRALCTDAASRRENIGTIIGEIVNAKVTGRRLTKCAFTVSCEPTYDAPGRPTVHLPTPLLCKVILKARVTGKSPSSLISDWVTERYSGQSRALRTPGRKKVAQVP